MLIHITCHSPRGMFSRTRQAIPGRADGIHDYRRQHCGTVRDGLLSGPRTVLIAVYIQGTQSVDFGQTCVLHSYLAVLQYIHTYTLGGDLEPIQL